MKKIFFIFLLSLCAGFANAQFVGPISRNAPGDTTYGTHYDSLQVGGYQTVQDTFVRNAIPMAVRRIMMLVAVRSNKVTYRLENGLFNSNWVVYNPGGGGTSTGGIKDTTVYFRIGDGGGNTPAAGSTVYNNSALVGSQLTAFYIAGNFIALTPYPGATYATFDNTAGTITLTNGTFASDAYCAVTYQLAAGSSTPSNYVLPAASPTALGGVKVGSGLSINGSGLLSATGSSTLPYKNLAIGGINNSVTNDTLLKADTINHTILLGTIVPENTTGDTIVFMGTSITKGFNIVGNTDTVNRWTTYSINKLKGFGFKEYNLGVPASVMNEQIGNIPVKTPGKRFLVIEYTANELNRGYDSIRFKNDLQAFTDTAIIARGWAANQLIILSCWSFEYAYIGTLAQQQQFNRALKARAAAIGAVYCDQFDQVISDPNYFWNYGTNHSLHPDGAASELASEIFASTVKAIFNPGSNDRQITNGNSQFSKIQLKNIGNTLTGQILGIDSSGVVGSIYSLPTTIRTQGFNYLSTFNGLVLDNSTARTIGQTDLGKQIEMNNGASNTVTIPTDALLYAPIGTVVYVFQRGAGSTSIAASAGVTILNAHSNTLFAQYSTIVLTKTNGNEWEIAGDLK